jgi:vanillate O-demethylase monooxygenase subunit
MDTELVGRPLTVALVDGTPLVEDRDDPSANLASTVRYGLVWCCLEPEGALVGVPDLPEFDDPTFRICVPDPYTWGCSATRRLENFVDFQHFAWVHEGLLGDRRNPFVPDHEVVRVGDELQFSAWIDEPNEGEVKRQLGLDGDEVTVENRYRVFAPASVLLDRRFPEGARYLLFASATPLDAVRSRTHWVIARNYALDEADDLGFLEFEALILDADQPIVESQRPAVIPSDLTAELHLKDLDRVSLAYRRLLADLGALAESGTAADEEAP